MILFDTPSGSLVIFKLCRIVIPTSMRSKMLSVLHMFHMSEQAMTSLANSSCWWPNINAQIESKYLNCITCMQLRCVHCPSTPVSEAAIDVRVMEVLSADFLTVGLHQFLIYADESSSFLCVCQFQQLTTSNSVDMLKDIIHVHGCPKMIVSDSGPLLCNDYAAHLQSLMVDHSYSEAYMPSRNGRAKHVVGLVKRIIQLNTPNGNSQLQDLI